MVTALIGIAALAGGVQNWFLRQTSRSERAMLIAAGLLLVYPGPGGIGLAPVIAVVAMQKLRKS